MPSAIERIIPPHSLRSAVGRAVGDFSMVREGDRILLGLSGGKDSLSLLHILLDLQQRAPVRFSLGVCSVDPQSPGFDPGVLAPYVQALGVPYWLERQPIVDSAKSSMSGDSFCAYCSRLRRGILYRVAREQGYNVLALAQHLDDLAETLLMSQFFGGKLRTMKANYLNDAGDIRVIRPLAYVRERQTASFARAANLPVIDENCPACFAQPTARQEMKLLLAEQERHYPKLFASLKTAMRELM